jgi:hypothetical protein
LRGRERVSCEKPNYGFRRVGRNGRGMTTIARSLRRAKKEPPVTGGFKS